MATPQEALTDLEAMEARLRAATTRTHRVAEEVRAAISGQVDSVILTASQVQALLNIGNNLHGKLTALNAALENYLS